MKEFAKNYPNLTTLLGGVAIVVGLVVMSAISEAVLM